MSGFSGFCGHCRKELTDQEAKSSHPVDRGCVVVDTHWHHTGVASVAGFDVGCYLQKNSGRFPKWRFCYCKECKSSGVALRSSKIKWRGDQFRIESDSNDSERADWAKEDARIVNTSEYQERVRIIADTANEQLSDEIYEDFLNAFTDFMKTKMRMKDQLPASSEGASAETNKRQKTAASSSNSTA